MEAVAGIFEHLGGADVADLHIARQVLEHPANRGHAAVAPAADDRVGRVVVVVYRGPLAQELGLEADVEVNTASLLGVPLEQGNHDVVHRPRDDGGADDEHVIGGLDAKGVAELGGEPFQCAEVLTAVRARRRADTEERELRASHRARRVVGDLHAAARDCGCHERVHAGFDDRGPAVPDQIALPWIDVDADHLMAVPCQTRERNGSHISQSKDADLHRSTPACDLTHRSMRPSSVRSDRSQL